MDGGRADGAADRRLAGFLGADAARGLARWERSEGWGAFLPADPWTSRGFTDAFVASLLLRPPDGGDDLNVVAKVVPPDNRREQEAHRRALTDAADQGRPAAAEFARSHLVGLVDVDAVPTPAGRSVYFQHLAGGTALCRPLADLDPSLQADDLVDTCLAVARAVAADWNGPVRHTKTRVAAFLDGELREPLSGTGSVDHWTALAGLSDPGTRRIVTSQDPEPLPNPLPAAFRHPSLSGRTLDVLTGFVHGDLHLGNVLVVRDGRGVRPETFRLIDLSTYRSTGPRVRDQVQLLLSALALLWPDLSDLHRDFLLTDLLRPEASLHPRQDPLVARLIAGMHSATWDLVQPKGFGDTWLRQYALALQAAALRFTTFTSLSPALRWWLLRLACRAAGRWYELAGADCGDERPRTLVNPFPPQPPSGATAAPPDDPKPVRPVALGGRLLGEVPLLRRPDGEGSR
ncbi:hypothetical protein ACIBVL_21175 [Streptomyces sp. NPDC049687]|uniref:hypothetical protein n=1 Tax=Streptomyces sp. NPDC049687 TaxID=3365596 RepID=UPI0037A4F887